MSSSSGTCAPEFADVRRAFESTHGKTSTRGAALTVVHEGRIVVDLWTGDARDGAPWQEDTICCAFSVAKAVTATAVAILVDRGAVDIDEPIATYWPEFAAAGKDAITLRMVLTHRAGTNYFPDYARTVSCDDASSFGRLDDIWARLAEAPPVWEPGTRVAYTSMTIGWIVSAIVKKVDGRSLAAFVAEEIAAPLELDDLRFGVAESALGRVADLAPDPGWESEPVLANINPDTAGGKGLFLQERTLGEAMRTLWNDDVFRQTEHGAINLLTTARDLGMVFALWAGRGAVGGTRLFSEDVANEFMREQASADIDAAIGTPMRLGLVFWRPIGGFWFGPNDETVAHIGLGGAVGLADPVADLSIAYVPAELRVESVFATDTRLVPVIESAFGALAESRNA